MPNIPINGSSSPTITSAWSGWNPVYTYCLVPFARAAANGSRYAIVTALRLWGGTGGTIGIYVANADGGDYQSSGGFGSVQSGGWDTGWRGLSKGFSGIVSGWEMRVGFTHSGTLYYGRHPAGGNIYSAGGVEWTGASLSGEYAYIQVPASPSTPSVSRLSNGNTRVQFTGSSDTGDSAITGWVLQYATNSGFSSATTISSSGTSDLNLAPGTYYFRAAGRNYVSDWAGTYGPWSGTASFVVSSGGRRYNGTSFVNTGTAKRYNGSSWVNLSTGKRWNGSSWVNLS